MGVYQLTVNFEKPHDQHRAYCVLLNIQQNMVVVLNIWHKRRGHFSQMVQWWTKKDDANG